MENKDVQQFYDVLSKYFNLDIIDNNKSKTIDHLTFFEENIFYKTNCLCYKFSLI